MVAFKMFLLATMTLLILIATGVLLNAIEQADRSTQGLMTIPLFEFDPYGVLPAGVLAIIAGCVCRLAFGHHRAWVSLSILYSAGVGTIFTISLYELGNELIRLSLGLEPVYGVPNINEIMSFSGAFLGVCIISSVGLIPARLLHPLVRNGTRRRYCKARKIIRRRQSRTD